MSTQFPEKINLRAKSISVLLFWWLINGLQTPTLFSKISEAGVTWKLGFWIRFSIHESILLVIKFPHFGESSIHDSSENWDFESILDSLNRESCRPYCSVISMPACQVQPCRWLNSEFPYNLLIIVAERSVLCFHSLTPILLGRLASCPRRR